MSRNLAFAQARGDHLLVSDSDIHFERPVLQSLVAELALDPSIGIVAPRLTFPSGQAQMSTDIFPTAVRKLERLFRLRQLEEATGMTEVKAETVDYAISAFWLMRRASFSTKSVIWTSGFSTHPKTSICLPAHLARRPKSRLSTGSRRRPRCQGTIQIT